MDNITDIHIKTVAGLNGALTADCEGSLIFPGAQTPSPAQVPMLADLLGKCLAVNRDDFMVDLGGVFFRGRRDIRAVDGTWYRLRIMAGDPPELDRLPSPIAAPIRSALLSPELTRGGLIMVAGGPGCGKTTTASAIVVSRLKALGGVAYTVEDPPEMPLNGRHGAGYCTQTMVAGDDASDWAESMRGVLRSQPVGTNLIMFVGEVRDAEAARIMLRAASNGFLVICTTFGTDLVSSIDTFHQFLGPEYTNTLSAALRMILFQKIQDGRFTVESLISEGPQSKVSAIIRSRHLAQLRDEVMFQRNAMMTGKLMLQAG